MTKILFVCHGNICRSPMAEYVLRDLAEKKGLSEKLLIASAATSTEEIGNPIYPSAREKLAEHGISCTDHRARQITHGDYEENDLIIGLDAQNIRNIRRICGEDTAHKVYALMDFTVRAGEVADPWYTGDFEAAWRDISEGCEGLLRYLQKEKRV